MYLGGHKCAEGGLKIPAHWQICADFPKCAEGNYFFLKIHLEMYLSGHKCAEAARKKFLHIDKCAQISPNVQKAIIFFWKYIYVPDYKKISLSKDIKMKKLDEYGLSTNDGYNYDQHLVEKSGTKGGEVVAVLQADHKKPTQ